MTIQLPTLNSLLPLIKANPQGNILPLSVELIADTENPITLFSKITRNQPGSVLLESVLNAEHRARYSFILTNPTETQISLEAIQNKLKNLRPIAHFDLPIFTGGYVGSVNYEMIHQFEPTVPVLGQGKVDFKRYDSIIVFDHFTSKILLISNLFLDNPLEKEFKKAKQQLTDLHQIYQQNRLIPLPELKYQPQSPSFKSTFKKSEFLQAVKKAKQAISEGEIFQVVLSQCFSTAFKGDPFTLYRALRIINPSPYMYYLNLGKRQIIGASPESLVRVQGGLVGIVPIAGTRPRGKTIEEDLQMENELLNDQKELAEHRMLLDLGRNDIGRVSELGSVFLKREAQVERYSHVMHLVSDVKGRLRKDQTLVNAFKSCFPAGTLSGAPKIRAMQLISELEKTPRDIYGGGIGYFDFSGNMDFAIAIRTFVIENGIAKLQTGAGIVHDSIPEKEYEETFHKGKANFKALNYTTLPS